MSTMTTQIRGGLTRLQVGAAACAVVAAAALPAVAANADTVPAPSAPAVTQILIDAPLAPLDPVNIAELPAWLENNRIESFRALLFDVVETVEGSTFLRAILPPYTDIGRLIWDAIGPYLTGRR